MYQYYMIVSFHCTIKDLYSCQQMLICRGKFVVQPLMIYEVFFVNNNYANGKMGKCTIKAHNKL